MGKSTPRMRTLRLKNPEEQRGKTREHMRTYVEKNKGSELFKLRKKIAQKKYSDKVKLQKQLQKIQEAQGEGYKSKQIIQKKVRQIEKSLPIDPVKAAQVCKELSKRHPTPPQQQQQKSTKELSEDQKKVLDFYASEENVVVLPGKRDFITRRNAEGQKVKLQKHVLKDSKENMFKKFQEQYPEVSTVHRTQFFKLAPSNVVGFQKMPVYSCECSSHKNFDFLFQSLRPHLLDKDVIDYRMFRKIFTCDEENFNCMTGICGNCKNVQKKLKEIVANHRSKIKICQWKGSEVIEHNLSITQTIKQFHKIITSFKAHSFISNTQIKARNDEIKNLPKNAALIVVDFAENMTLQQQNETQAGYYRRTNVTIYTCMVYIHKNPNDEHAELERIKIAIISDDLQHNSLTANVLLREILTKIKAEYPHIQVLKMWSDGAPSHFKNKSSISNIIALQKEFKIKIESNFTGSGHGKSVADSIGGTVKRMVGDRMMSQSVVIQTAEEFASNAEEICDDYEILFVPSSKIKSFELSFSTQCEKVIAIQGIRDRHKFVALDDKNIKSFRTSVSQDEKIHKVFKN